VDNALRAQGLPVFGLNPDLVEAWIVQVRGLDSAGDYSRVVRHFTRIRGVRKVDVDELHDDVLRLRMIVEGGVDRAAQLAEADGLIARDETGAYVRPPRRRLRRASNRRRRSTVCTCAKPGPGWSR
jgi:hypothetical protein